MIYFKACHPCQGDMLLERDQYGQHVQCIQCGYETDPLRFQQEREQAQRVTVNVDAVVAKILAAAG